MALSAFCPASAAYSRHDDHRYEVREEIPVTPEHIDGAGIEVELAELLPEDDRSDDRAWADVEDYEWTA